MYLALSALAGPPRGSGLPPANILCKHESAPERLSSKISG